MLQCLCSIFDHSNSPTTVCLLCSCRWNLEMTPCLNFTEVAPDALSVSGWHSLQFQTTYSFSVLRNVSQALFVFCAGLCCGPLTPPTGHLRGRHSLTASGEKLLYELRIHGLHFGTKLNFINKEAKIISNLFFMMLRENLNYSLHKMYFFLTPVSKEPKVKDCFYYRLVSIF